ncbi:hypothetical protein F2P56_019675, partial [Juglans regia]
FSNTCTNRRLRFRFNSAAKTPNGDSLLTSFPSWDRPPNPFFENNIYIYIIPFLCTVKEYNASTKCSIATQANINRAKRVRESNWVCDLERGGARRRRQRELRLSYPILKPFALSVSLRLS